MAKADSEVVGISRYQAATIEDGLRLAMNTLKSWNRETAMDRVLFRSWAYIKELQSVTPNRDLITQPRELIETLEAGDVDSVILWLNAAIVNLEKHPASTPTLI